MSTGRLLDALRVAADGPSWMDDALCAEVGWEAFYPEKGEPTTEAKRVCARCDVRAECLEWALAHDERFGVWGGLSEQERRKLVRPAAGPVELPAPATSRPDPDLIAEMVGLGYAREVAA